MATVTVEIEDDEILVALKRGEGYEDVHPQLIAEEAIGDRWPEYRTIQFDKQTGGDRQIEELTQAQQFTIWYERICRDRDYAARYYDLANRISDDRKAAVEMLDWIEEHVTEIRETFADDFQTELKWIDRNGKSQLSVGLGLRDAIRKSVEMEDEHVHKWEKGMDGGTYVCECGAWK